ncbi:unnamed protein product [Schistosoma mattheei]|uniref:Uncharacterized protein n=1 Tax=Schistosoma mattheei TaxID=31246 RepID=A0A183Q7T0_9TREM|nr:unnamed protein product [Schistosoma mattheei]
MAIRQIKSGKAAGPDNIPAEALKQHGHQTNQEWKSSRTGQHPSRGTRSIATRQIKSGKAAGPDNIPAEALKADVAVTARILHILFNKIWGEEQVPTDWKEGLLIKITMKGDLSNCDNYRGITLLSIPGKVINRVLLNRMKDSVDAQLRDQQAGFSKDR